MNDAGERGALVLVDEADGVGGGRRVCHGAPATSAPVDHASRASGGADGASAIAPGRGSLTRFRRGRPGRAPGLGRAAASTRGSTTGGSRTRPSPHTSSSCTTRAGPPASASGTASPAGRARPAKERPWVLGGYRRTADDRGRGQARPFGAADFGRGPCDLPAAEAPSLTRSSASARRDAMIVGLLFQWPGCGGARGALGLGRRRRRGRRPPTEDRVVPLLAEDGGAAVRGGGPAFDIFCSGGTDGTVQVHHDRDLEEDPCREYSLYSTWSSE